MLPLLPRRRFLVAVANAGSRVSGFFRYARASRPRLLSGEVRIESTLTYSKQRFQPPTLLCIKTSLILFYVRLFPSKKFRLAGWIIFGFTLAWAIGAWLASLLECTPVSFFWDKTIEGYCVPNPLITVGLTSGVVSCVGDLLIFAMPIPVLSRLQMNTKKKIALIGVFALGILCKPTTVVVGPPAEPLAHRFYSVICTSFVRWIALLGTASDVTCE